MNDRIRKAFDNVHADENLKENTLTFIQENTGAPLHKNKKRTAMRLVPAMVCLILMLGGGSWLYYTPVAAISLDINPSIEMEINRFDRVLSAEGCNDDGRKLAYAVDVKHMKYSDAVDALTSSETVDSLLAGGEVMAITIIDDDQQRGKEMCAEIRKCIEKHDCVISGENAYCYYADSEDVAKAHDCGLSYGKYCALKELQKSNPDITAEDVQGMTMREMHQMRHGQSSDDSHAKGSGSEESSSGTGSGQQHHHGNGNDSGNNRGNGNDSGNNRGNGNDSGNNRGNGNNHHGE